MASDHGHYGQILKFWFEEAGESRWWAKDAAFDRLVADRFIDTHRAATRGELFSWRSSARGRLAEVIVLDQFSRNIYRNTPDAFAWDGMALVLAQEAVAIGTDQVLAPVPRSFFYLPYMHSESLLIHEQALALYQANGIASGLEFEIRHRDIIARFGRYPHRNAILGRESSPQEIEFLKQPGSSF